MNFRNFSIKIKNKEENFGCSEGLSYPVLSVSEKLKVRQGKGIGIDSTSFLISNDSYEFIWVPANECEFVDLT